jgi:peptide/nickel transport system substrate-binding protein
MASVNRMKRLPAALIVCIAATAACGREPHPPAIADGDPAPGGTVVIGVLGDIQSWNPYLAEDENSAQILSLVYPSLAIEQTDYRLHPPSFAPHLATSWEWSDDRLELVFHLARNARWSDGVPVTADDVVYSWETQLSGDVAWPYADSKGFIERVEVVDAHTVRFTFSAVYPYQLLDANDGLIVPSHLWSGIPYDRWQDTDWSALALAAGPFRMASHVRQQEFALERYDGYWKPDRPYLDRVVWRVVPSKTTLLTQLVTGEIDLMALVPPADAERVRQSPGLKLIIFPDRGYSQIRWNLRQPVLADRRVRRALSLAIDCDTLIDVAYNGYARRATGPILSDMWAFNRELEPLPYDPDTARALLAEAGWSDRDGDGILDRDGQPLELELMTNAESDIRQDSVLLVEENLNRIGVRIVPRFVEWGTLLAAERRGEFDAILSRWIEPTVVDLSGVWHSAAPGEPTFNSIGYSNPEVDQLLAEVDAATDFDTQKPLFDRIQELIVADQPYTFLAETVALVGLNSRIRGTEINDATPYFNLDEWYVNVVPTE